MSAALCARYDDSRAQARTAQAKMRAQCRARARNTRHDARQERATHARMRRALWREAQCLCVIAEHA